MAEQYELLKRITRDPAILSGKPTIRGMCISAELILSLLAHGEVVESILAEYPELEPDDIRACFAFAHAVVVCDQADAVRRPLVETLPGSGRPIGGESAADLTDRSRFERLLHLFRRGLTAELAALLLNVQTDKAMQARYEDLAVRSTEGQLSEAEQRELGSIVRVNGLLSVLKAEARAFLQNHNVP